VLAFATVARVGERISAMNHTTDDLNHTDEEILACETSDDELEAAADTTRWVWTKVTTSCGGANC
jgi:hypothetical protein